MLPQRVVRGPYLDHTESSASPPAPRAPVTLCGRRDIPRTLTGYDLKDAQEKADESAWTVCPTCMVAFVAAIVA
jgi:hypothetical protein